MDSNTLQTDGTDLLWNSDKLLTNDGTAYNEMISSNIVNNVYQLNDNENSILPVQKYFTGAITNGSATLNLILVLLNTTYYVKTKIITKGAVFEGEIVAINNENINAGIPLIQHQSFNELYNESGYLETLQAEISDNGQNSFIMLQISLNNNQNDNYIIVTETLQINNA